MISFYPFITDLHSIVTLRLTTGFSAKDNPAYNIFTSQVLPLTYLLRTRKYVSIDQSLIVICSIIISRNDILSLKVEKS